ncbi:MAG: 1-phosphofructokinase family hexose kinase [Armatimonadota bacterium]
MFLTVTLNPALDKTLWVDRNLPQTTVRARRALDLAGGKGINVARALLELGAPARAFMPLAGPRGAHVADLARGEGMEVTGVPVAGETRTAITVCEDESGTYWHYLEPGPQWEEADLPRLREGFLWALDGCHSVAVCGSLPSPAAAPLVGWMVREARQRGLRVALDSFGPLHRQALEMQPWLAKPTLAEWESATGERLTSDADRWSAVERMHRDGVEVALLSLGAEGALAMAAGERYRIVPPRVEEVNDLGCGDSMVAGLLWAAAQGYSVRECLAWGGACGAANAVVWDPGGIRRADVERLLGQVEVRLE